MADHMEEFGQNGTTRANSAFSELGVMWYIWALDHLNITWIGTLNLFTPNIKQYMPGTVVDTEWYSSKYYKVTASMDNKKVNKR